MISLSNINFIDILQATHTIPTKTYFQYCYSPKNETCEAPPETNKRAFSKTDIPAQISMSDLRFHPNIPLPVSVRATVCHAVPQRVIRRAESTNEKLFVLGRHELANVRTA
jgi:hypothetical protein